MKRLSEILPQTGISAVHGDPSVPLESLHFDSREVKTGGLFFAVRGTVSDGHLFIRKAIENGAVAVVCELAPDPIPAGISVIVADDSASVMGSMAASFYDDPSSKLELVGITGTNGKTTTVTLLYRLFMALGYKSGLLSTVNNMVHETSLPTTHTTPDPVTINRLLREMVDAGCRYCFMEVSSHAVDQKRIGGLTFRGGVFTNLTHDHLDYHKTFEAYLEAKKGFFDNLPADAFALINKDDRNGPVMLQNTRASKHTYSLQAMADFRCRIVENQFHGLELSIDDEDVWFRLTGRFNAYNLLAAYATARLLGQGKTPILTALSALEPVEGRFNTLVSPNNITAIVDYAHTPDALKNVLETIHDIRTGDSGLITVAGAGGNRDAAKRPLMARIACDFSDRVILTSDNPRFEEPEAILEDMRKGVDKASEAKVLVITNRKEAIRTAVALARPGDVVLVAGKGHETYQEIRGVKYPFDDTEVVREAFGQQNTEVKPNS